MNEQATSEFLVKRRSTSGIISTFVLLVVLIIGAGLFFLGFKKGTSSSQQRPREPGKAIITEAVPTTGELSEGKEVRDLVARFEKYINERNVSGLMDLYTPAKTKEEVSAYRTILGLDSNYGPILFSNVTSNFIVTNWKIARRQEPDSKELITKGRSLLCKRGRDEERVVQCRSLRRDIFL